LAELKVYLPDELDQRFRKTAMNTYGYGRGSLSKAAVEALSNWCADHEPSKPSPSETTTKDERPQPEHATEQQELEKQPEASQSVETDHTTPGSSLPTA